MSACHDCLGKHHSLGVYNRFLAKMVVAQRGITGWNLCLPCLGLGKVKPPCTPQTWLAVTGLVHFCFLYQTQPAVHAIRLLAYLQLALRAVQF